MSETVDIIVKENGSAAAAANVRSVGTAADASSAQMEKLLLTMQGSNLKLAEIARATGSVESQMMGLGRATSVSSAAHKEHNEQMARGAEQAGRLREMLVAVGLALGVHEWIELTDAYQRNVNGLVQVTSSQENLVNVQKALKVVSMDTFSSLDENTNLFVKLSKASKDLNITQGEMIEVVRVLNEGLRLAGNSTSDAGRAIQQLSIAMMTGEGSSRAMLSIMRQMPDLTQAIAAKFFNGRDAVVQFKHGVEGGTISIQQVVKAMVSLSSQADLTGQSLQRTSVSVITGAGRMGQAMQTVTGDTTKFEQQVKKLEPTVANAWTNIKSALFSYVGEADQASGASDKLAHVITVAAEHGRLFFGIIGIITAFLVSYTTVAGAAYAITLLFTSAFSRFALVASILAAVTVAVYTFGSSIYLTADHSITVLGALKATFDYVRQGVMYLWDLLMQAPGYWGPAIAAVGGLTIAMKLLLGVNLIQWLITGVTYLGAFTLATIATLGPWGLLVAAIVAATLAWAYYTGQLDGAIATIKEKLTPAVNALIAKMKEFSVEANKGGSAAKDFGDKWGTEIPKVTDGFKDGLLPAIKNVDAALEKLKADAVQDMSSTASSVKEVAAALNSAAGAAGNASSAIGGIKQSTRNTGDDPKTYQFAEWNTPDVLAAVGSAWQRAAQISAADGKPAGGDYDQAARLFAGLVDDPNRNGGNKAEIIQILSKLSDGARTYLRNSTVGAWVPGLQYGGSFGVGGHGGTDSQLVQFMASPDETVTVQTPQQVAAGGVGGRNVTVHMMVVANDAESFRRTGPQIATQLESRLQRVALRGGG